MPNKQKLRIAIIGCGAIGTSLAEAIVSDFASQALLVGLYDIQKDKALKLAGRLNKAEVVSSGIDEGIKNADLIIEATKAESAFEIAQKALLSAKNILIMSVGGIIGNYKELKEIAEEKRAYIYIPSGAICGIDGLKAVKFTKIKKVVLTTKKPPKAFEGVSYLSEKRIDLKNIKEDTLLFEGNALAATKAFPKNINVAATLSLAGIGPDRTLVRIIASPSVTQNIHEISIESDAGRITTRTENIVHPENPKTSYLAVLSAMATLKNILGAEKIGN